MAESGKVEDMVPLAICSAVQLTAFDWAQIRAAKESLQLPFLVQPATAVAGTQTRVLAIGVAPTFLCDYAFVPSTASPGLKDALEWVLTDKEDARAVSAAQMISAAMRMDVKEITNALGQSDPRRDDERPYREHFRDREPEDGSVIAGRRSVQNSH